MKRSAAVESLVVADFGRGSSRAYLVEQVAGAFRFVAKAEAPTTAEAPFENVGVGWQDLLRQLEWDAGRRLTEREELLFPQQARGDGVDAFMICSSLGEPLRVALIEATANPVSAAISDALKRTHSRVFHLAALAGRKDGSFAPVQVEALRAFRPEYVVLSLDHNQPAVLARQLVIARQLGSTESVGKAVVIGEAPTVNQAVNSFGSRSKVRVVTPSTSTPVRIAAEIEQELSDLYRASLDTHDFAAIARDAPDGVVIRAQAVDLVNRFIARAFDRRVITIACDDGSHVHWANANQGLFSSLQYLDLGVGISGLTSHEVADAARWLPFATTDEELMTWVLNRAARPWTVPTDTRDLRIEQAMARQIARRALAEVARNQPLALAKTNLVIGGQAFARWNQQGSAALALLDSVDVVPDQGVIDLALDQDGLMAIAGTVGLKHPDLASELFEYDGLSHLGSAVVIGGQTHEGDRACRGEIQYESGETTAFSVGSGSIEVLPLRPGETASLILRPERRFSVGGYPSGKPVTLSDDRRIIGGAVGVIVDARGRALGAGQTPQRHAKVKQWIDAVNGVVASSVRRTA